MKAIIRIAVLAVLVLSMPGTFAQQSQPSTAAAPQAAQPLTPEEFDRQFARMQEQMSRMQEQMTRIQQTQDPKERQRLLEEHWTSMQAMMTMMHGAWGGMMCCANGPMMGGPMAGGHMMGGPMMMWGNYQALTPEQLKQRQYMMDRWVPMQQMMMNHMMWHQHWMQSQPPPAQKP